MIATLTPLFVFTSAFVVSVYVIAATCQEHWPRIVAVWRETFPNSISQGEVS